MRIEESPPQGYISVAEAIRRLAVVGIKTTTATMIVWIEKHDMGFQPGGINSKWYVSESKFREFLDGKTSTTRP